MKKETALKVSKHPLIRKIIKDATIPKNIVARLIIEEMGIEEVAADSKTASAKSNLNTILRKINQSDSLTEDKIKAIQEFIDKLKDNPGAFWSKYDTKENEQKEIYNKYIENICIPKAEKFIEELNKIKQAKDTEEPKKIEKAEIVLAQKINTEIEKIEKEEAVLVNKIEKENPGLTEEHVKIAGSVSRLITYLRKQGDIFLKRSDGSFSEVVDVMFWPTSAIPINQQTKLPEYETPNIPPVIIKQRQVKKNQNNTKLWEDIYKAKRYSIVFFIDPNKIEEKIGDSDTAKVYRDITIGDLFGNKMLFTRNYKDADAGPSGLPAGKEPEDPSDSPSDEPGANEDPEKFDVDNDALEELIKVSEKFIEEFYEKTLLKDQGVLLKDVLDQLSKIIEKEELEKAAQRKPQQTQGEEETVQEEQQNPTALRNIQVGLKSFIKVVKQSKETLKAFKEAGKAGKTISSSLKKKFLEIIQQIQDNIKELVKNISKLNVVQEVQKTSDKYDKWAAIEDGYDKASVSLRNIISYGSSKAEDFDMENNVKDAYEALMSISHFFPSVNPFGKKTSGDMGSYYEQYEEAIKNIKDVLRDVLELAQGDGGSNTAKNAVIALKKFSGEIQNIFGVNSSFKDVQIQPNEPAAEDNQEQEDTPVDIDSKQKTQKTPSTERVDKAFKEFFAKNKNIFDDNETRDIKELIKVIDDELVKNSQKYLDKALEEAVSDIFKKPLHKDLKSKVFTGAYNQLLDRIAGEKRKIRWVMVTQKELFKNALKQMPKKSQEKISSLIKDQDKGGSFIKKIQSYIYNMLLLGINPKRSRAREIYMSKYDDEELQQEQILNKIKPLIRDILNKGR